MLAAAAGILAAAADLTVDLPAAAPKWISWTRSVLQVLPDASFFYGFLTACIVIYLVVTYLDWRLRRRRQVNTQAAPPAKLGVHGSIDALLYAFPSEWGGAKMSAAFEKRAYACLCIRNARDGNIYKLVARCFIDDAETPCFWSQTADGRFARGGNISEDLPVDHDRLLVIAQAYGDKKLWARLPADQEFLFHPNGIGNTAGQRIVSPAGEVLDFGAKVELKVRFRAEGLPEQVERFGLGFDAEGPTITKL